MTPKLEAIIQSLEDSCSSESLAVADCLKTIAENGDEQAEDDYLVCCAMEIRDAAQSVIDQMRPKKRRVK